MQTIQTTSTADLRAKERYIGIPKTLDESMILKGIQAELRERGATGKHDHARMAQPER